MISLFIPIFNEEGILERDINEVLHLINKLPEKLEIFIVDDASTDHSAQISDRISTANKAVKHLRYDIGPTRRENLAQSFRHASGEIIAFMDIDLSTNLKYLEPLIDQVKKGYDIATGSRYVKGSRIKRSFFRLVVSMLYNNFIRFYFQTNLMDHECGFKAFKRDVILRLVDEMGYDKKLERGVFWDTEMLIRAERHNYKVIEIPIEWHEANKSALNFKREIKMIPYILKLKKKLKEENRPQHPVP
ncbi:MAG: glycosyltransferase [Candidatus Altiarchaeota archaeon]